jgi:arsenate reductase (thioredoxin)
MFTPIKVYCDSLVQQFDEINAERKLLLERVAKYISGNLSEHKPVNLIYICTHNSRRSHFGQVWAKVASEYYGIRNVNTFSGGTEATAFNVNAINALTSIGFEIKEIISGKNPQYGVVFSNDKEPVVCFSKVYTDAHNPQKEFAAIMTCSDAEENCPFISGADLRIATTYDDPKAFDNTPLQEAKYSERCRQIALETLYIFFKAKEI